jgi:hypothetical protein
MKKVLIIIGAILLAALIAGGSFYGGIAYQTNQANQARASFMAARGMTEEGQFPGGNLPEGMQPPSGGGRDFSGGGASGVVKTIDGNVITISTAQDVTTVTLSDDTRIEKYASAAITDLQPGVRVTVTGQRDDDGNITASQIMILNNNASIPDFPSPTGTEP